MIGTVLGERYEILDVVGSGGMAIVYKAKDRLLDRFVAVKMLREELQDDREFVERFKAEARSAASLNHPNVVSVFDVGTDGDREYFVMEYIEGVTLKEIIESKTLTWKRSCAYGVQIAGAIEHAHRKNIVHRDIKPHNIMITKDNVVKVTDFGIARAVTTSTIVRAGNVIGSVHYFSPEQACGGVVDFKSDIYSMGVVLYEMLTGRVPFDAENPVAIAKMHVDNQPQPPIEINAEIPEALNDIVLKAMSKQPMKRYQSPALLAADLKQVASNPSGISVKDNDATQFVPVVEPSDGGYHPEKKIVSDKNDRIIINGMDPEPEPDVGRKTASWLAWVIAGFVFVLSLFIIVAAVKPSLFGFGDRVNIPELRGLEYEKAVELCEELGFTLEELEGDFSEYPAGQIMEQKPQPGDSKKVEKIEIKISKGLNKISLRDYTGEDINAVKSELGNMGIDVVIEKEEHDTMPVDTVISHSPSGGSMLKKGSSVTFYVSTGKKIEMQKVPNLNGMTLEEAAHTLGLLGLRLGDISYVENKAKAGKIVGQSINAGEEAETDTAVNVTVGQGTTSVPSDNRVPSTNTPVPTPEPTPEQTPTPDSNPTQQPQTPAPSGDATVPDAGTGPTSR